MSKKPGKSNLARSYETVGGVTGWGSERRLSILFKARNEKAHFNCSIVQVPSKRFAFILICGIGK